MPLPEALRHRWIFDVALSSSNADGNQCYRCEFCKCWTDAPDAAEACSVRERRKGQRRQFADRRGVKHEERATRLPIHGESTF